MKSVELFAGAGGLALGCELAGFESALALEWDRWACDTIRANQANGYPLVANWRIHEGDVRQFDWTTLPSDIDLVTGGPPCQPFSMGGKHRAADDSRDMFPAATEAIAALSPKAFILENVKGLTRAAFSNYFQYILLRLEMPELISHRGETWFDHFMRLQSEHTSSHLVGLRYNTTATVVNAADYGVPQSRHRVFIVGFRDDLDAEWSFPEATHSRAALVRDQSEGGTYWQRHGMKQPSYATSAVGHRGGNAPSSDGLSPWRTVRDAISDLPRPKPQGLAEVSGHILQTGARSYPGHTGSPVDLPAKTLKAGDHGVPGGENMLRNANGSVRYFTVRESARLQTFPDAYAFHGSWTEAMRQLGNAVPVLLAQRVAGSVKAAVELAQARSTARPVLAPSQSRRQTRA